MFGMTGNTPHGRWLCMLLCLIGLMVFGCDWQSDNNAGNNTGSGELQVRTVWHTQGAPAVYPSAAPSGDVCRDFLITHIRVRVRSASDQIVADSNNLACSQHSTRLNNITAGDGYRVEVEGLIDGQVYWYGQRGDVTVVANQTTDPIEVNMAYTGDPQLPPQATISPANGAANIATDTAITILFNVGVVAATVNTDSVTVSDGVNPVSGTLNYDPDTHTAVFQPDPELAVSTTYTVHVTTEVMDHTGQNMTAAVNAQFTTTTVWYVDQGLAESGDGRSWGAAFRTIEEAITASAAGDHIWIRQGTYPLIQQINVDKPVVLLGGFDGTETQHHQRDWRNRPTRVDASNGECRCFYLSANAVIDGLDITGFSDHSTPILEGGIMYIDGVAPRIENCTFRGSDPGMPPREGGAIYITTGNPQIHGCTFLNNRVVGSTTGYGGAIHNVQGGPTISECRFIGNSASGMGGSGGAIANFAAKPATRIQNCVFISNSAGGEAGYGGGIYNEYSDVLIEGCRFESNTTSGLSGNGGAMANHDSDAVIQNCVFDSNRATGNYSSSGGAMRNFSCSPSILHSSFYGNEAIVHTEDGDATGGAVASYGGGNPTITNAILWANQAKTDNQVHEDTDTSHTISYCNIDQFLPADNLNFRAAPRFGAGLHLRSDSPCIGIGANSATLQTDMDGEGRPQGDTVDLGADEFFDSDGDGLPDYWEQLHAIDNPDFDPDGDGIPAISEFNLGTDPGVAEHVLDETLKGRVASDGTHVAADTTTTTGGAYRAYLGFSVAGLTSPVTRAAVRLELTDYDSSTIPVTLTINEVSTDASVFATDLSGATGTDVYDDLALGTEYGTFEAIFTDEGTVLDFRLNRQGLEAINTAITNSRDLVIGLTIEQWNQAQLVFGQDGEDRTHQLILTP